MIALAFRSRAELATAWEIASVTVVCWALLCLMKISRYSSADSAFSAIRDIVNTDSTGYFPAAVSPDSMIASVPSKMALATSLASARVGLGLRCIESSICVAVITGLPTRLHFSIMRFCTNGTSSAGISTPKSPRATIRPSETSKISSRLSTPCWFSILEMIWMCVAL
ncbi:hypothetical protein D1872_246410 [compost metagenome]